MLDKTKKQTWLNLKAGDIITLTDEQTISDLIEDKAEESMRGLDLTIETPEVIEEQAGHFKLVILPLKGYNIPLWLIVKIVGSRFDLRIYFEPEDFEPGNREDVIESGSEWLFDEPEDPDDFVPSDLEHADEIENEDPDTGEKIIFKAKSDTSFGEQIPVLDKEPVFVKITEYKAVEEIKNPELITIEYGGLDEEGEEVEEGGYMTFFQGAETDINSLDLMPVTSET